MKSEGSGARSEWGPRTTRGFDEMFLLGDSQCEGPGFSGFELGVGDGTDALPTIDSAILEALTGELGRGPSSEADRFANIVFTITHNFPGLRRTWERVVRWSYRDHPGWVSQQTAQLQKAWLSRAIGRSIKVF